MSMTNSIKDALAECPHVWVTIPQNPMKKPLWPPVPIRVNEYMAVLPRSQKVLIAEPLLEQLEHAAKWGRENLNFVPGAVLSASEAHAVRLQTPDIVFPQTCTITPVAPAFEPQPQPEKAKKGK